MLKVGAIGYRNHAKRMLDLVEAEDGAEVSVVHHPDPAKAAAIPKGSADRDALLGCDAVMVLSPTDSHFDYLTWLAERFEGWVLCEKPPVSTLEQLDALKLPSRRVFFNFNQRFGLFREVAEDALADGTLGEILNADVLTGHGLAFKPGYETSWRADAERHRHGVAETVAIHWLDLLSHLLGRPGDIGYRAWNVSGRGTANDTCHFTLRFAGGAVGTVAASYAQPFATQFRLVGTSGLLEYRHGVLTVRSPRDSFDENGFFTHAPVVREERIDENDIYWDSLKRSLGTFLDHVRRKKPFPEEWTFTSLASCRMILELA